MTFHALDLGGVSLYWLDGGGFRNDGGAMFGPVPRRWWAQQYPPAEDNTVPLTGHVMVVQDGSSYGLVDSGLGHHLSEKQRRFYSLERESRLEEGLAELGIGLDRIDWVVLTHLHLDHAGGVLKRDAGGQAQPVFPRARLYVQSIEAEDARDPGNRSHAVYAGESFAAFESLGLVEQVNGTADLTQHVQVFLTGGHTRGHQGVLVRGTTEAALLHLGDVVITHAHLPPAWVSGLDDYPLETIRIKREWLGRAAREGWWVGFSHDARYTAGRLDPAGRLAEKRAVDGP